VTDATKKARREQARENARIMREAEQKRKRRNRILIQSSVIVGALAIATVIVLVVANSVPKPMPGPLNMASDGILLVADGEGAGDIVAVPTDAIPAEGEPVPTDQTKHADTVNIVMYLDYFCPICKDFETTNALQIGTWVSQGLATIEYHPIAILDSASQGTRYSTRSANAAACVANFVPNRYFQVTTALFASQPEEGTTGLDDDELIAILESAGVTGSEVETCVRNETFSSWVTEATDRSAAGPIPNSSLSRIEGTPTVIVNGQQYTGSVTDADAFTAFVTQIGAALETGNDVTP
jgi:protein-disulfide isomerase